MADLPLLDLAEPISFNDFISQDAFKESDRKEDLLDVWMESNIKYYRQQEGWGEGDLQGLRDEFDRLYPDRNIFGEIWASASKAITDTLPLNIAQAIQGEDVPLEQDESTFIGRTIAENKRELADAPIERDLITGSFISKAIEEGLQSSATSIATTVPGALAGAKVGSAGGVVGAGVGGVVGSMALTGPTFFRMAKNQILTEVLDHYEREGIKLNEDQWEEIKQKLDKQVDSYGWWEAGPEMFSSAVSALIGGVDRGRIGKAVSTKVLGDLSGKAMGKVINEATKFGLEVAEELGTESLTGMKQSEIEKEIGLREESLTYFEAGKESLAGVVGGSGATRLAFGAVNQLNKRLRKSSENLHSSEERSGVSRGRTVEEVFGMDQNEVEGIANREEQSPEGLEIPAMQGTIKASNNLVETIAQNFQTSEGANAVISDFFGRLMGGNEEAFNNMDVEFTETMPEGFERSPMAYDPNANKLYVNNLDRNNHGDTIVNSIIHESGHFVEQFILGSEFASQQWDQLSAKQKTQAWKEYLGKDTLSDSELDSLNTPEGQARARSEWVAFQFKRIVQGEYDAMLNEGIDKGFLDQLQEFWQELREFTGQWLGAEDLSTAELDARVKDVLGFNDAPPGETASTQPQITPIDEEGEAQGQELQNFTVKTRDQSGNESSTTVSATNEAQVQAVLSDFGFEPLGAIEKADPDAIPDLIAEDLGEQQIDGLTVEQKITEEKAQLDELEKQQKELIKEKQKRKRKDKNADVSDLNKKIRELTGQAIKIYKEGELGKQLDQEIKDKIDAKFKESEGLTEEEIVSENKNRQEENKQLQAEAQTKKQEAKAEADKKFQDFQDIFSDNDAKNQDSQISDAENYYDSVKRKPNFSAKSKNGRVTVRETPIGLVIESKTIGRDDNEFSTDSNIIAVLRDYAGDLQELVDKIADAQSIEDDFNKKIVEIDEETKDKTKGLIPEKKESEVQDAKREVQEEGESETQDEVLVSEGKQIEPATGYEISDIYELVDGRLALNEKNLKAFFAARGVDWKPVEELTASDLNKLVVSARTTGFHVFPEWLRENMDNFTATTFMLEDYASEESASWQNTIEDLKKGARKRGSKDLSYTTVPELTDERSLFEAGIRIKIGEQKLKRKPNAIKSEGNPNIKIRKYRIDGKDYFTVERNDLSERIFEDLDEAKRAKLDMSEGADAVVFASGLSRSPADIDNAIKEGKNIGVAAVGRAGESEVGLSANVKNKIVEAINKGLNVFIDTGGFTAFTKGVELDLGRVFLTYSEIANNIDRENIGNLYIVAPDVIGDQGATLELIQFYQPFFEEYINAGANVIVPVQKGEMSPVEFIEDSGELYGGVDKPIWGIPYNKVPLTKAEILEIAKTFPGIRLHLLGGGSKKVDDVKGAIDEAGHDVKQVSGDSLFKSASERKRQTKESKRTELITPSEKREQGEFTRDGVTYKRQDPLKNTTVGTSGETKFSEEITEDFTYVLVEKDDLQPSHKGGIVNDLHFIPEAQPKGRDDKASDKAANAIADNPNLNEAGAAPIAYTGAPIVNERGEVIQGNNRSEGLRRHYSDGGTSYKGQLSARASEFGLSKDQVESMNEPILVRMVKVSDDRAIELGNLDVRDIESGGTGEINPVTLLRQLSDQDKATFLNAAVPIDETETLQAWIKRNSENILNILAPNLNETQQENALQNGVATNRFLEVVEEMVISTVLGEGDIKIDKQFKSISGNIQQGILKAVPNLSAVTNPENSIVPELQSAILAIADFDSSGFKTWESWLSQEVIPGLMPSPLESYGPAGLALAKKLIDLGKKSQIGIRKLFGEYKNEVNGMEADLLNPDGVPGISKDEAIQKLLGVENEQPESDTTSEIDQDETSQQEGEISDNATEEITEDEIRDILYERGQNDPFNDKEISVLLPYLKNLLLDSKEALDGGNMPPLTLDKATPEEAIESLSEVISDLEDAKSPQRIWVGITISNALQLINLSKPRNTEGILTYNELKSILTKKDDEPYSSEESDILIKYTNSLLDDFYVAVSYKTANKIKVSDSHIIINTLNDVIYESIPARSDFLNLIDRVFDRMSGWDSLEKTVKKTAKKTVKKKAKKKAKAPAPAPKTKKKVSKKLDSALDDLADGLLGAPATQDVEQESLPADKLDAGVKLAQAAIDEGIDNPQSLAELLDDKFGKKLRKYYEAIWDFFGIVNKKFKQIVGDWGGIFNTLDSQTEQTTEADTKSVEAQVEERQNKPEPVETDKQKVEANGLFVEQDGNNWLVTGNTFKYKDGLKTSFKGNIKWVKSKKAWRITSEQDPTTQVYNTIDAVNRGAKVDDGKPGSDTKSADDVRRELREREDGRAKRGRDGDSARKYVDVSTADLIKRGLQFGIPQDVVNEQIEDIGKIKDSYDRETGMFLLANGAGSGKTFVLGGAIRDIQQKHDGPIIYVTMSQDLIKQIKKDLADFGIEDVQFITYSAMSNKKSNIDSENAVLVFDEAHNIKNPQSARGKTAQNLMAKAKHSIIASATPFENPVQAKYLSATGIFNQVGSFEQWALAYGASAKKTTGKPIVYWSGGKQKLKDGIAARDWFFNQGVMTQRPVKIPGEMIDSSFKKTPVSDEWLKVVDQIETLYDDAAAKFRNDETGEVLNANIFGQIGMHRINLMKRVLEASKMQQGIDRANEVLNEVNENGDPKNVVIFVETKADRLVGRYRQSGSTRADDPFYQYPEMLRMHNEWQIEAANAKEFGSEPPRKPFADFILEIAESAYRLNVDLKLPSVEQEVVKALGGEDKVAVYTGSVSNSKASKDKEAFLSGKKRVIVATMAKGGTGLSLHDKVGNRPTVQVNINLPWVATGVDQVSGRVARYGLQTRAEIEWLFASNIDMETMLATRVGGRMRDMGAVVSGVESKAAEALTEEWDFAGEMKIERDQQAQNEANGNVDPYEEAERLEKSRQKASDTSGGFFETPYPLSTFMTRMVDPQATVLEPSAGHGSLLRFMPDDVSITAIEQRKDNFDTLQNNLNLWQKKGDHDFHNADFLEWSDANPDTKFDSVIMNPPFERLKGVGPQDAAHVMRAFEHLKEDGRLVAIMGEGVFFREAKADSAFREFLDDQGAVVIKLPQGAFKQSGTMVNARMVILDKVEMPIDGRSDLNLADVDPDNLRNLESSIMPKSQLLGAPAYHASKTREIEGFDTRYIGTGEGAQAFGWGIYLTDLLDVAKGYLNDFRKSLEGSKSRLVRTSPYTGNMEVDGVKIFPDGDPLVDLAEDVPDAVREHLWDYADTDITNVNELVKEAEEIAVADRERADKGTTESELLGWAFQTVENIQQRKERDANNSIEVADWMKENIGRFSFFKQERELVVPTVPAIYKAEILPKEEDFILYDNTLVDQHPKAKSAIKKILDLLDYDYIIDRHALDIEDSDTFTWGELYNLFKRDYEMGEFLPPEVPGSSWYIGDTDNDKHLSMFLLNEGIKGIKFKTGSTRNRPERDPKFNYVLFEGADAEIRSVLLGAPQTAKRLGQETATPENNIGSLYSDFNTGIFDTSEDYVTVANKDDLFPIGVYAKEDVLLVGDRVEKPGGIPVRLRTFQIDRFANNKLINPFTGDYILGAPQRPIGKLISGWIMPKIDNLRYWAQDSFIDLKRLQEKFGRGMASIPEALDVYLKEELYKGRVGDQINKFRDTTMKELLEFLRDNNIDIDRIGEYMVARHARERNERIRDITAPWFVKHTGEDGLTKWEKFDSKVKARNWMEKNGQLINPSVIRGVPKNNAGSGMLDAEADAILAREQATDDFATLDRAAKKLDKINKKSLFDRFKAGLITRETFNNISRRYKYYTPLIHADADEATFPKAGQGYSQLRKGIDNAGGRTTKVDPIETVAFTFSNAEETMIRKEKNRVLQTLLNFALRNPDSNIWQVETKLPNTTSVSKDGVSRTVPDQAYAKRKDVVTIKKDGQNFYIQFNGRFKRLASAFNNTGSFSLGDNAIMKNVAKLQRFFAATRTSLNPAFVIPNFIRDYQTAGINLQDEEFASFRKPALSPKNLMKSMAAIRKVLRDGENATGDWVDTYKEYTASGGKINMYNLQDIEVKQQQMMSILKDERSGPRRVLKGLKKGLEFIEDYNSVVESGVRLSAYKAARDAGWTKDKAAQMAKNLTVNFDKKGMLGTWVNSFYLFFNAGVQGTAIMFKHAWKSPRVRKSLAATMAFGAFNSLMQRLIMGQDEEDERYWYDKESKWVRDHNIVIMNPFKPGTSFRIPLPYGYNTVYAMGANIVDVAMGETKAGEAAMDMFGTFMHSFNPVGGDDNLAKQLSPTLTDPAVELIANKNFMDLPIAPEENKFDQSPPPASQQYFSNASDWSVMVADLINDVSGGDTIRPGLFDYSPNQYEHIFDFMAGGTGTFVEGMFTSGNDIIRGKFDINKLPVVNRFYREQTTWPTRSSYNGIKQEIGYINDRLDSLDGNEAKKYKADNRQAFVIERKIKATDKKVKGWSQELKDAKKAGNYDRAEELSKSIEREQKKIVKVAKDLGEVYND